MPIAPLYGHEALRSRFRDAARNGTLPASLLLTGPRGVGKQRLALWLAELLLCTGPEPRPCGECQSCRYSRELTHPDLHWVFPRPRLKNADAGPEEAREAYGDAIAERVKLGGLYPPSSGSEGIFVVAIRMLVQAAALAPAIARGKVFVVGDAERMVPQESSQEAANAFLKLLEEPPANTTIILTSSEPGSLLPTIRSRVVMVRVPPVSEKDVRAFVSDETVATRLSKEGIDGAPAELARVAAGAPGRLLGAAEWTASLTQAQGLLEAATGRDRSLRARTALSQGGSRARGSFTDALDALTVLLHERVRSAADESNDRAALGAARAIEAVERAKELAAGNVNPQLISSSLLMEMGEVLA